MSLSKYNSGFTSFDGYYGDEKDNYPIWVKTLRHQNKDIICTATQQAVVNCSKTTATTAYNCKIEKTTRPQCTVSPAITDCTTEINKCLNCCRANDQLPL